LTGSQQAEQRWSLGSKETAPKDTIDDVSTGTEKPGRRADDPHVGQHITGRLSA
jgi:hypothetical protein